MTSPHGRPLGSFFTKPVVLAPPPFELVPYSSRGYDIRKVADRFRSSVRLAAVAIREFQQARRVGHRQFLASAFDDPLRFPGA